MPKKTISRFFKTISNSMKCSSVPSIEQATKLAMLCKGVDAGCYKQLPLSEIPFIVFDTETTGLHPYAGDEMFWIAALDVSNMGVASGEGFQTFINPHRAIPAEVEQLTGVKSKDVVDAPEVYDVLENFLQFVDNKVIVAHRSDFDLKFINIKLRRHCGTKVKNIVLDTALIYRALYPATPDFTLDHLIEKYDLPSANRHTAPGDTFITAKLLVELIKELKERRVNTLSQLLSFLHWHSLM